MSKQQVFNIVCVLLCVCATSSAVLAAAPPIQPGSWTLAILPDTQMYAADYPDIFNAQTQFLADNKTALNLAYVLHEGDLTDNNTATQWSPASAAFQTLDNADIRYSIVAGNHDIGDGSGSDRTSLIADYFPLSRLKLDQPALGGVYPSEPTSPQNSYSLFSAGGTDWLVLALELAPRDQIVDWADSVLKGHPNRQAMIVTHAHLYSDDTRYDWATKPYEQKGSPYTYGVASLPDGINDGEEVWNELKDNPNLQFIFSGHVTNDGTGYLPSTADAGNVVHQVLANYQFLENGGNGYMRLLEFLPDGKTVHVRTYSPYLDSSLTAPDQDFTLTMLASGTTGATMHWDTSTDAEFQAGNGTWNNNNAVAWSDGASDGTSPGQWTSIADNAVFDTSGTSVVTVSGSPSAHSVTFSGTGYTLSGTMIVGAGGVIANERATITAPTLSASQSWTIASGKHLLLVGNTAIDVGAANTLTLDGPGTLASTGVYAVRIANGTVVQTNGGIYSASYFMLGTDDDATFTTTGGALNMAKDLYLGYKDGITSTINQDGGTIMVPRHTYLGATGYGTGVYNLNAGVLKLSGDTGLNNTYWDSYEFNFNGGEMELSNPNSGSQSYTFNVKAGGAKIDVVNATVTNTFNGALLEDVGSTGGGLQKLGLGTLVLNGANTYTGDTLIDEGTLSISQAYLADTGDVWVASGAILDLGFTGFDAIHSLYLDGAEMTPGLYDSGNSGGYITGTGSLYVVLPGDANGDGSIDAADAAILASNWLSSGAGWNEGDFNGDEIVNDIDATILAANWQNGVGSSMASVPEPSTMVLLIAAAAALLGLVRR